VKASSTSPLGWQVKRRRQVLTTGLLTFLNAPSDVRCHANPHTTIVLVGNKSDLDESKRQVTYEEADRFAKENGIALFLETSAKSASNVEKVFVKAAEHVYEKIKSGEFTSNEVRKRGRKRRRGVTDHLCLDLGDPSRAGAE
jgi:GTPase SAR1 family protein